jgi:hypothetical protein
MQTLTVYLKIPFESAPPTGQSPGLVFTDFPMGRDQGIQVGEDKAKITLWFDENCSWFSPEPNEEGSYSNVHAQRINVEVEICGLSDSFLAYMQSCDGYQFPAGVDPKAVTEYEHLAKQVLTVSVNRVNRLIAYARSHKAQSLLNELTLDFDRLRGWCDGFQAQAQIDNGPWFRFSPPTMDCIRSEIRLGRKYITKNDWPELREFVAGSQKPNLVGELLAGAEYLMHLGHSRSAITEAVTALEVAIYNFSRAPNIETAFGPKMAKRLGLSTLQSQVQHLGLSGTIGYLFPVIIPDELLSAEVLAGCQAALTQRQNVVHNGQRSVKDAVAKKAIADIRACCNALDAISLPAGTKG